MQTTEYDKSMYLLENINLYGNYTSTFSKNHNFELCIVNKYTEVYYG